MKVIKFVLLGFGLLAMISVFLPYISVGSESLSLWQIGQLAGAAGKSALPVYATLGIAAGLIALAGYAVRRGSLTRPLAGGALAFCVAMLFFMIRLTGSMGAPSGGLLKHGSIGFFVLWLGALAGAIASVAALVKPEDPASA